MISLEISATIAASKLLEFNQSKLIFIDHLQNFEGYVGFKEKAGKNFIMQIDWESRKTMNAFLDSEDYRFFHGAIITLSKSNSIKISSDSPQKDRQNKEMNTF